jgi:uncharacterized protein (TIGR02453 family)
MVQTSTLQFLAELKLHNEKSWMDANRPAYLAAKADIEQLAAIFIQKVGEFDSSIANLQAKDCTFRINRDIRFSNDKAPYKTNMAIYLSRGGKKSPFAGYYLHIEPQKSFLAGGVWMPEADKLKKIRQEIDYNWQDFNAIISNPAFVQTLGALEKSEETSLSRPPKGYTIDHPGIDYLKLKSFIATSSLSDAQITQPSVIATIVKTAQTLHPLIQFLNVALGDEH